VATLPNGQIIVAGGGPPSDILADVELYTPSTNKWQRLTPLLKATIPTGAVVGDTFYVIGGFTGPEKPVSDYVEAAAVH